MIRFTHFLAEKVYGKDITQADLDKLEVYLDQLYKPLELDVEFTKHFLDRVNDERNKKPITMAELIRLFNLQYQQHGKKIAQLGPDAEAVLADMSTDINTPIAMAWNKRTKMLELRAKTVMRKKNFLTRDKVLRVK